MHSSRRGKSPSLYPQSIFDEVDEFGQFVEDYNDSSDSDVSNYSDDETANLHDKNVAESYQDDDESNNSACEEELPSVDNQPKKARKYDRLTEDLSSDGPFLVTIKKLSLQEENEELLLGFTVIKSKERVGNSLSRYNDIAKRINDKIDTLNKKLIARRSAQLTLAARNYTLGRMKAIPDGLVHERVMALNGFPAQIKLPGKRYEFLSDFSKLVFGHGDEISNYRNLLNKYTKKDMIVADTIPKTTTVNDPKHTTKHTKIKLKDLFSKIDIQLTSTTASNLVITFEFTGNPRKITRLPDKILKKITKNKYEAIKELFTFSVQISSLSEINHKVSILFDNLPLELYKLIPQQKWMIIKCVFENKADFTQLRKENFRETIERLLKELSSETNMENDSATNTTSSSQTTTTTTTTITEPASNLIQAQIPTLEVLIDDSFSELSNSDDGNDDYESDSVNETLLTQRKKNSSNKRKATNNNNNNNKKKKNTTINDSLADYLSFTGPLQVSIPETQDYTGSGNVLILNFTVDTRMLFSKYESIPKRFNAKLKNFNYKCIRIRAQGLPELYATKYNYAYKLPESVKNRRILIEHFPANMVNLQDKYDLVFAIVNMPNLKYEDSNGIKKIRDTFDSLLNKNNNAEVEVESVESNNSQPLSTTMSDLVEEIDQVTAPLMPAPSPQGLNLILNSSNLFNGSDIGNLALPSGLENYPWPSTSLFHDANENNQKQNTPEEQIKDFCDGLRDGFPEYFKDYDNNKKIQFLFELIHKTILLDNVELKYKKIEQILEKWADPQATYQFQELMIDSSITKTSPSHKLWEIFNESHKRHQSQELNDFCKWLDKFGRSKACKNENKIEILIDIFILTAMVNGFSFKVSIINQLKNTWRLSSYNIEADNNSVTTVNQRGLAAASISRLLNEDNTSHSPPSNTHQSQRRGSGIFSSSENLLGTPTPSPIREPSSGEIDNAIITQQSANKKARVSGTNTTTTTICTSSFALHQRGNNELSQPPMPSTPSISTAPPAPSSYPDNYPTPHWDRVI